MDSLDHKFAFSLKSGLKVAPKMDEIAENFNLKAISVINEAFHMAPKQNPSNKTRKTLEFQFKIAWNSIQSPSEPVSIKKR